MKIFAQPILFAIAIALFASAAVAKPVALNVREFGAVGDGKTVNTAAIQRAIDDCSKQGGGVVEFPAGQFVSGTILLKDNVILRLATNATLLGSLDIMNYQNPDPFISGNGAALGYCFIGAVDVKNVGIEGAGMIDGRGKELLAARPAGNSARPFLVRFVHCTGVTVRDVHLQGPAAWTVHFFQSRDVKAERVTIFSRGLGNNDGIDIDSCQSVRISGCDIDSGDDAICFKTTSTNVCRDVSVTGCKLKSHWAAIKFGTESAGNFEDIKITDCRIRDTEGGGIKLFSVDGSNVRNILISDVTMDNVTLPVFIRLGARLKTFREGESKRPVGSIQNIVIRNVRAVATWPIGVLLSGIPGHAIENVTLTNVSIQLLGGGTGEDAAVKLEEKESAYPEISMFGKTFPAYGLFARHVNGLKAENVKLELATTDVRPAIQCEDVVNLEFTGWKFSGNIGTNFPVRFDSVRKALFVGFSKPFPKIEGQGNSGVTVEER